MSLSVIPIVNKTGQNNNQKYSRQNVNFAAAYIYNKSSNGKFDVSEAVKNFGKGIISPITGMFSSLNNFALGVGMIAGTSILMAATSGAIAPILVASGLVMGGVQVTKAGIKMCNAKNGDDVEKAFFDVGGGASTLGLSALGAKSALSQASIKTEGLKTFGLIKKCFTSSKDLAVECFNVFKSGYFKTNLRTAYNVIKNPQSIRKYSEIIANEGRENFDLSFESLKKVFPDEYKPLLKGRLKCQISIYEKIIKERKSVISEIKSTISNKKLNVSAKKAKLKNLNERLLRIDTDMTKAKEIVGDTYGARLVLDSPRKMDNVVEALVNAVKKGDMEILEIENHYAKTKFPFVNSRAYLNKSQQKQLSKICATKVKNNQKEYGYTAVHLKVKLKNSKIIELQVRGLEINTVADWEHIPYDLRLKKDIAKGNNNLGISFADVRRAALKLSKKQKNEYNKYIYDNYKNALAKEYGDNIKTIALPNSIDEILSAENLIKLHSEIVKSTPAVLKNPYDLTSQASLIASIESLDSKVN